MKSNNPRKKAVKTETTMTMVEKITDCLLVGQLTCESSPWVSLK